MKTLNPIALSFWLFATSLGTLIGEFAGDPLAGGSAGMAVATGWSWLIA
jgi:hypothetical protein